eukprot:GGOE01011548.1.p1 GENE.GGOE01011548.1~~GGOE01011548.1.p1  ORF type:complete len:338 (+),score=68.13 GGOE01011548.1:97-1014(+)
MPASGGWWRHCGVESLVPSPTPPANDADPPAAQEPQDGERVQITASGAATVTVDDRLETPVSLELPSPIAEVPDLVGSSEAADAEENDFDDALEAFATPYEYTPVQLSFGCFGPLSADTQVFRVRNVCGQKIEVRDSAGELFLKGVGVFKPVGYYFDFYDSTGQFTFSIATVDLQEDETYEFIGPHGIVNATAMRKRFRPRTDIRVCANTAKCSNPVEVECKSVSRKAPVGGRYRVATPEGLPLGTIRRHHRKGVVTHQNFTVVVGPEVDPYLMIFLAVVCNCINNERPKIVWTMAAAALTTILI